jgi:hypothetical protein
MAKRIAVNADINATATNTSDIIANRMKDLMISAQKYSAAATRGMQRLSMQPARISSTRISAQVSF